MHIITQFTMHKILCQQRLDYVAFLSQFQVKTSSQQDKLSALTALSILLLILLCEDTTSNYYMNIISHLTVINLYNHFHHDTKTSQDFISIQKKLITSSSYDTKPYLTVHNLHKHFAHTITSSTSHHQTDFKISHYHVAIESFSHNISTLSHKLSIITTFLSLQSTDYSDKDIVMRALQFLLFVTLIRIII